MSEFYTLDRLSDQRPHCLANLSSEEITRNTYVEVNLRNGRKSRYISALLPASLHPRLHDEVEISPTSCKDGVVPVIRQVLSTGRSPEQGK